VNNLISLFGISSGKVRTKKKPEVMVTDYLPLYIKAFLKEFFMLKKPGKKHSHYGFF